MSLEVQARRPGHRGLPGRGHRAARDAPRRPTRCRPTSGCSTAALEGDHNLFASEQTIEEAWRIVDPILGLDTDPLEYEPGTWGPAEAEQLPPNHHWFTPHVKGADTAHPADTARHA